MGECGAAEVLGGEEGVEFFEDNCSDERRWGNRIEEEGVDGGA